MLKIPNLWGKGFGAKFNFWAPIIFSVLNSVGNLEPSVRKLQLPASLYYFNTRHCRSHLFIHITAPLS